MNVNIKTPKGQRISVEGKIGNGCFGDVYVGKNEYGNEIAIKVVCENEDITLNDIKDEIKAIRILSNLPNTMRINELFYNDNKLFVFMPKYKSIPVDLDAKQIAKYFYQILLGLNAIHEKGYVHGDIKKENIMLNDKDEIRIIDFGISVPIGSQRRDICPHIYKSKRRLVQSIESFEKLRKRPRENPDEEVDFNKINFFPKATPYDDLVCLGYTIISLLNSGKLYNSSINSSDYNKNTFEKILNEMNKVNFENRIYEILCKKCPTEYRVFNFLKNYLKKIFTVEDASIPDMILSMEDEYSDIIELHD